MSAKLDVPAAPAVPEEKALGGMGLKIPAAPVLVTSPGTKLLNASVPAPVAAPVAAPVVAPVAAPVVAAAAGANIPAVTPEVRPVRAASSIL